MTRARDTRNPPLTERNVEAFVAGKYIASWVIIGDVYYCMFTRQAQRIAHEYNLPMRVFHVPYRMKDKVLQSLLKRVKDPRVTSWKTVPLVFAPGGSFVGGAEDFQSLLECSDC